MKKKLEDIAETKSQISFESFGVKVGVRTKLDEVLTGIKNNLGKINPHGFEIIDDEEVEHLFKIKYGGEGNFVVTKDDELIWSGDENFDSYLQSMIRLTIAEFAAERVFLHAGAVAWKGKAIVFPASSFSGKSSLVAEMVKRGALYYSDDFAVLDKHGLLHPFHRQLSLRGSEDKCRQVDFSVEELGGKAGAEPIPVGMVLITEYKEENKNPKNWQPEILTVGQGIMEILAHTIPIRYNPKFSLEVLNKITECAIIGRSQRGDAKQFADLLINFFETKVIK